MVLGVSKILIDILSIMYMQNAISKHFYNNETRRAKRIAKLLNEIRFLDRGDDYVLIDNKNLDRRECKTIG